MCGMDIPDFFKMFWCKLFPPGPYPTSNFVTNPAALAFLAFHHSVSLCAGLPCMIYFADKKDFQWLGVMLAGAPLTMVVPDLVSRCVSANYEKCHTLVELVSAVNWTWQ